MKASPDLTDQAAWSLSETLSDRLSEAADLQAVCDTALQFVLQTIDRPGGMLLLQVPGAGDILALQDLSETWVEQATDRASALRSFAQHVLESAQMPGDAQGERVVDDLALALPIVVASDALGVLLLQGKPCSSEQVERLQYLMPAIGRAVRSRGALHALQERTRELAALQSKLARVGFRTDFEDMQTQMVQGACRIVDGEVGALILLDESNEEWMVRKALGEGREWIYQINPRAGRGLVRACLHAGEPLRENDVDANPDFDPASDALGDLKVRSMLCAPLVLNGEVLGAIQILNKRRGEFSAYDQDLLSMIATLTANAIHGARLVQRLKVVNADLEASRWELIGSRNTLRALFDSLPLALYIVDPEYKLVAINQSRARLAGHSPKALVERPCYQALFDRSAPCLDCRVLETLNEGASTRRNERRWVSADEAREWQISTYPISNEDQGVVQAILLEQDITEKHYLEGILAQSEKLAAIGQLAAGVAHEINNPLTAIIANAQILHRELPSDSDLQESVDLIARAGARATQVVRNLLDFARKEDYNLGLTDLNETLQRAMELVQHEILARGVKLEFKPNPNLSPILASQDHLQSVWLNLLLNAIDSLDKSPGVIKVLARQMSDEIHVSVIDNGKGIPPERLTRIFEPFYTTKKAGRGTGLGLSVCHRIVKQHGGQIRVESQIGVGSEFTVILPMS